MEVNKYNEEGLPDGVHIGYHDNGIVSSIENFCDGAYISLQLFTEAGLLEYSEAYGLDGTTVMWWNPEGDLNDARWREYKECT